MTKKIRIDADADPAEILDVVQRTAEQLGFTVEPTGPAGLVAHDGGTKVSGNVTATRARVAVRVEPGEVRLKSETTGAAYAGAGAGFFTARINWRYAKLAKQVKTALGSAGLS